MNYSKKLVCVKTYVEDLTRNNDFDVVWKAGNVYDAVHHKNGTWSVKTEQGKDGIIGEIETPMGGYFCNYETHFADADNLTILDVVRYAYGIGYFTVEDVPNHGCIGIHCEAHGLNENGFYAFGPDADQFESAAVYSTSVGDYGICQGITSCIESFIEDNAFPEEAERYLLDIAAFCHCDGITVFDNVLNEWIGKAEDVVNQA